MTSRTPSGSASTHATIAARSTRSFTFVGHYQSPLAQVFDLNPATNANAPTLVRQLVAYLLSIDGSTAPIAIPALGASGGDLCSYTP